MVDGTARVGIHSAGVLDVCTQHFPGKSEVGCLAFRVHCWVSVAMERRSRFEIMQHAAWVTILATVGVAACGQGSLDDGAPSGMSGGGGPVAAGNGGAGGNAGAGGGSSGSGASGGGASSGGGAHGGDGGALSDAATTPQGQQLFEALLPGLESNCGGACHQKGIGGAPLWLGPPDPYTSAVKYPGIVVTDPGTSIIVTKGRHEGPALVDPLLTQVMGWLTAEAAAIPVTMLPASAPFSVTAGSNDVDCSPAGIPGMHITFGAVASGNLLTLSNVSVVAPSTTGVSITYPIFAILPPMADEIDDSSLSAVDQTIAAGATAALGPGTLILTEWQTNAKMKIEFTKIAKATASDGGLTGGCKALTSFTTNAVPAIQNGTCLTCHNTGGSGNAAMDLSGLASNPVNDTAACAQALTRANPANPAQSDIILAPTGQVANHPFKGASQSFVTMMETWIAAEK
jgi:hypothetical protein